MEKEQETTAAPEEAKKTPLFNRVLKMAAYPAAALSGFWATSVNVHNSAYNKAKALGAFDDILETATTRSKSEVEARRKGQISLEEFSEKWPKSKLAFQEAAEARMKYMGLDSFKNKWKYMAKESKQEAVLVGLTVTGIAIGALLTIANSKTVGNLFGSEKDDSKSR
jgi:hypothetical protein